MLMDLEDLVSPFTARVLLFLNVLERTYGIFMWRERFMRFSAENLEETSRLQLISVDHSTSNTKDMG